MTTAVIILWLGCLIAFLGSNEQKLLVTTLNKKVTIPTFFILLIFSWMLFNAFYSGVTAALLILSLVMVMWLTMIFVQGHFKIKLLPFALYGGVISTALVQLGGL